MRKHTVILEDFGDNEYELDYEPTGEVLKARIGDHVVMSYLTYDQDYSTQDMGDCMGELISFHRHNEENHERGFRALKEDRDAILLDCYSHSGEHWSIHGGGMQCQWDTARGAGVYIPSAYEKEVLTQMTDPARDKAAREYAQSFLDELNSILAGDVYGCVTQVFHEDGGELDSDSCWGFVGSEHAEESLLHEFFEPMCKVQQAKYEEECRTASGKQLELEL